MKKIISVVLALVLVFLCATSATAAKVPKLRFGKDGKFTILHLTDPQDDQYIANELDTFITKAVQTVKPDLVVITGDFVEDSRRTDIGTDGKSFQEGVVVAGDYEATLENVKKTVHAIFTPLERARVYYTVTLGNNDYASGIKNSDWLKIFASYPHCIATDMSNDKDGKIDSYLEIYSANANKPAYGLWLLDNGRGFTEGQKSWFKSKKTSNVPSIVFEHIPISDVGNLFEECHIFSAGALINQDMTGLYRLNKEIASGNCHIPYPPTGSSSDVLSMWKKKGVKAAFFGHIHTDGYTGTYDGITLGLTYGFQFSKGGPYGYRVIELSENGNFTTDLYTYSTVKHEFKKQVDSERPKGGIILNIVAAIFNTVLYPVRQVSAVARQL